jgi:hypothetical protein
LDAAGSASASDAVLTPTIGAAPRSAIADCDQRRKLRRVKRPRSALLDIVNL